MWILFFLLLILWIGIGSLLLYSKRKPTGKKVFLRAVDDKWSYNLGENVNVTVTLIPPIAKTAQVEDHDIILVLDHSGSMGSAPGSPLREAVRAMENFVKQLPTSYHISLIVFDHEAQQLCRLTAKKKKVLQALKTVGSGGGTQLHLALNKCQEVLDDDGRDGVKKTLILLSDGGSDRKMAEQSAQLIRGHVSSPTLICVSFGPYVDEALMKSVASSEQHYIHVEKADNLEALFDLLANAVSGASALAVLIEEKMPVPDPFGLKTTGELYPVGVHQTDANYTQVAWLVSLLEQQLEPIVLNYTLATDCLGWHSVALADTKARWKMPDGGQEITDGIAGPKVLVLPNGFAWAWPLLNPLFWILFGRFFSCEQPAIQPQMIEAEPLPIPTLPEPLPIPTHEIYRPRLRPALVIGLGELGEWTLTRFKWQLQDRNMDKALELLAIQDSHLHNRPATNVNGCVLSDSERLILHQDLRPYLEQLRTQKNTPALRGWIPWQQWLRETRPLTTYADDRRKARLALLLQPDELENVIQEKLERVSAQEGLVLVVAGAIEAEGSGMLAEVAHICASHDTGVTAIVVPDMMTVSSPETRGLVRELERMLVMRGESITSDRGEKTVSAQQLFDRVIVANDYLKKALSNDVASTSENISHLLWNLLAYPTLLEQMPSAKDDTCYRVLLQGNTLPQRSLWHWVREQTLSDLINRHWLRLSAITERQADLPTLDSERVQDYVVGFWNNKGYFPGQLQLLLNSAQVLSSGNPLHILDSFTDLPLEKPYYEQKAYCDRERKAFSLYLGKWCHTELKKEAENAQWGLPTLFAAVTSIEHDLDTLIENVNKLSGNTALTEQLTFIISIYTDYKAALNGLRSNLANWIAVFVGWQPEMSVNPLPQDFVPVCIAIERQKQIAVNELPFDEQVKSFLQSSYKKWYEQYGDNFQQQLRFQVKLDVSTGKLMLELRLFENKELTYSDLLISNQTSESNKKDINVVLREALDNYQNVIFQWPTEAWVSEVKEVQLDEQPQRIGQFSKKTYPRISQAIDEDDPFVTTALSINPMPLNMAFRLDINNPAAVYVWPEESNAARIADKIRHHPDIVGERESVIFPPKIVSLMRDTKKLYGFMAELAENRVVIQGQQILLTRETQTFEVGSTSSPRSGIAVFEDVVRQVVTLGTSLHGEPLPLCRENWIVEPEKALKFVEKNPLANAATDSPDWEIWKDVIRGLALANDEYTVNGINL